MADTIDDSDDEFDKEVERAHVHATALTEHLIYMGADRGTLMVEVNGRTYKITIDKLPHPNDFNEI